MVEANEKSKIKSQKLKNDLAKKNIIENDFLKIKINANGTFDLFDKVNKKEFKGLGYFYDEGEAGHAWVNIPTKPFITTLKSKPKIKLILNGKLSSTVKISH